MVQVSLTGIMEPRISGRKRVSVNDQISVFHTLSQVLMLRFLKWQIFAFLRYDLRL